MATITLELSDEALVLLAERALRRGHLTAQYGSQVIQQALLLGDRDALVHLHQLKFNQIILSSRFFARACSRPNPPPTAVACDIMAEGL